MILLNDDEIGPLVNEGLMTVHSYVAIGQMVAKAQLKKVVGILKERELAFENDNRIFVIGDKLWQALLKEVE